MKCTKLTRDISIIKSCYVKWQAAAATNSSRTSSDGSDGIRRSVANLSASASTPYVNKHRDISLP
jgi:hypothetical protein